MTMQARLDSSADKRFYDVNRDIAHCFSRILIEASKRFDHGNWVELDDLLVHLDISDDEMNTAMRTLINFTKSCCDDPKETITEVLTRTRWLDNRPDVQIAILALLGNVLLGYAFVGIREASGIGGSDPIDDNYQRLEEAAKDIFKLAKMPRWRRKLYVRLRNMLRRLYDKLH